MTTTPTLSAMISRTQPSGDCLMWQGSKSEKGYGIVTVSGRRVKAHRLALQLSGVRVQSSDVVRHTCDRPGCINPAHLLVGTHSENIRDRDERGRTAKGERIHTAKLTADQVYAIRSAVAMGECKASVARRYGVSRTQIYRIAAGVTWKG